MDASENKSAAEEGLSEPAIRRRRRSRRVAHIMLVVAAVTAIAGWKLFGASLFSAIRIKDQPPSLAIIAYGLLIISSVTLILGLWYLLIAQVERLARIVDADELPAEDDKLQCGNCGWPCDSADRFCRHCGRALHTA